MGNIRWMKLNEFCMKSKHKENKFVLNEVHNKLLKMISNEQLQKYNLNDMGMKISNECESIKIKNRQSKIDIDFVKEKELERKSSVVLYKGKCIKYYVTKGFGFVSVDDGSGDVFVHRSEIKAQRIQSLAVGENVEFEIVIQDDGRRKAVNLTGPNGSNVQGQKRSNYENDLLYR